MINYESERSISADYFYSQFDENLNFPAHIHHSFEYVYCFEGEICLNINENTYKLTKGQATVIFPSEIHSYLTSEYSKTCLFVFSTSYINSFYEKYKTKKAANPVFDFAEYKNINLAIMNAQNNKYLLKSFFYFIIAKFAENTSFISYNEKAQNLTLQIVEYVSANYTKKPSLHEISNQLGYSYNYISGFIKKIFHLNFMQLVNRYRIGLAQNMLTDTSENINNIALACGYESVRNFNRNFLAITGFTPSQYREMEHQSPDKHNKP